MRDRECHKKTRFELYLLCSVTVILYMFNSFSNCKMKWIGVATRSNVIDFRVYFLIMTITITIVIIVYFQEIKASCMMNFKRFSTMRSSIYLSRLVKNIIAWKRYLNIYWLFCIKKSYVKFESNGRQNKINVHYFLIHTSNESMSFTVLSPISGHSKKRTPLISGQFFFHRPFSSQSLIENFIKTLN